MGFGGLVEEGAGHLRIIIGFLYSWAYDVMLVLPQSILSSVWSVDWTLSNESRSLYGAHSVLLVVFGVV